MCRFVLVFFLFLSQLASAQNFPTTSNNAAQIWADSVFKTLSPEERIAQLMIVRLSTINMKTKEVTFFDDRVADYIKKYNIGGICLFQGGPVKQVELVNALQAVAKTPLLMCIDAEWGVGQRILDSVSPLPKQMMLGAMTNDSLVYAYGKAVAAQCRRMGIQVNYAPVVDVNNNPNNPVINDRSFGEDKYKVARFAIQYMKGMQDNGVMACAKHFPGHGDVAVDSHYDLPVINKSMAELDSLELFPFRKIFAAGVSSAMIAHLYIPSIDKRVNRATSISKANVDSLLRFKLGFNGLTFTDALDMKGVTKFFPDGEASVEAIIAGNDLLCLPEDVPVAIEKIKAAIADKRISIDEINMHCKKVLAAKYQYGLSSITPAKTAGLTEDLNKDVPDLTRKIAENAITLLAKKNNEFFPFTGHGKKEVAYVAIGTNTENAFAKRLRTDHHATVFYFDYTTKSEEQVNTLIHKLSKYKKVVIGVHNMARTPGTNFGLSKQSIQLVSRLQQKYKAITFIFGNAYAVKNWCDAGNLVLCYEDDAVIQQTAADMLGGKLPYKGVLPVTVCPKFTYGFGL